MFLPFAPLVGTTPVWKTSVFLLLLFFLRARKNMSGVVLTFVWGVSGLFLRLLICLLKFLWLYVYFCVFLMFLLILCILFFGISLLFCFNGWDEAAVFCFGSFLWK